MEWLKKILEAAQITDGKLNIDDVMKQVNAEFPKNAVPKDTYNTVSEQLKTSNATIETLKKNGDDVEKLKQTIKDYETTITSMKTEAENKAKTSSLIEALKAEKVADPEYFIFKQGGIDKFNFGQDGKPVGVSDAVKPYKESNASWFEKEEIKPGFEQIGAGSGSSAQTTPGEIDATLAEAFGVSAN